MEGLIEYRIVIVGGPFDGTFGMKWHDDGEHPLPDLILLGTCPGNALCNSMDRRCSRKAHTYYWTPEEKRRPVRVFPYELSESYIEPEEPARRDHYVGQAIYAIGGLHLPRAKDAERELAVAGTGTAEPPRRGRPIHAGYPGMRCRCMLVPRLG